MKVQVDVVTGFLDSGKTTFINGMMEDESLLQERIVIIQCESGEIEIENELINDKNIFIKKQDKGKMVDSECISEIIREYLPDRIIIEYNGMESTNTLFNMMDEENIRRKCVLNKIVNTIDATTFEIYMNNMGTAFIEQLSGSDLIVLNKTDGLSVDKLNSIEKTLKVLNKYAEIAKAVIYDEKNMDELTDAYSYPKHLGRKQKFEDKLLYIFIGLVVLYLMFSIFRSIDFSSVSIDLSWLQALNTVFLSILMQAIPFILIGVFVSSILQVIMPSETIIKIFPKKMGLGFIVAIFMGVLFPVCDCAVVPVATRLIKKGVPIPAAITFMLSAPLVNPIVVASTLYAFPGQPLIAFYRVCIGITVALAVGVSFFFFPEGKPIFKNDLSNLTCSCGYCNGYTESKGNIGGKIRLTFKHAGIEFFEVGRFLIVGAFLSSILQTMVPKTLFNNLGGHNVISLLVMMAAAFVFSVCSTSDAFIARTFLNQFSTRSILGFLVLGPMIDIKNMLMLFSSFKKWFVIMLVSVIFLYAFVLLYLQTLLLI